MGFEQLVSGHVESLGHGIADANENPDHLGLPSVNPVFTWVRLAQRIPVRIHIDAVPPGVMLAAGMTCSVAVGEAAAGGRLLSRLSFLQCRSLGSALWVIQQGRPAEDRLRRDHASV